MLLLPLPYNTHPFPDSLSGVPLCRVPLVEKPLEVKAVATPSRCFEEVSIAASSDWRQMRPPVRDEARVAAHAYFDQSVGAEKLPGNCQI